MSGSIHCSPLFGRLLRVLLVLCILRHLLFHDVYEEVRTDYPLLHVETLSGGLSMATSSLDLL